MHGTQIPTVLHEQQVPVGDGDLVLLSGVFKPHSCCFPTSAYSRR